MDSTALLNHFGPISYKDCPLLALSVDHPLLSRPHMKGQKAAQANYLRFAKKKGYHIVHERVVYSGNFSWNGPTYGQAQPSLWLLSLIQVLRDHDTIHFGYIQDDIFWHYHKAFSEVFDSVCKLFAISAELSFPFEWMKKKDVYETLRNTKVPNNCWFSCENTSNGKSCGVCDKCKEIKTLKADVKDSTSKRPKKLAVC